MQKILLIASIVLMAIGMILFFLIGALIHDFNCMWAGIGIFLIGIVAFIVWIFLKAYLSRKEEEKNNIKRG